MTTILVVEDEETVQETLAYNLQQEGYSVLTADDGEQALKLIRQHRPDLVVLDIMLPRLDGLAVCRVVRKDPEVAQTPIIMLTARGTQGDKMVGLDSGADDYITKPFGLGEFLARVRAVLRRVEGRAVTRQSLEVGDLTIDLTARRAHRGGEELHLLGRLMRGLDCDNVDFRLRQLDFSAEGARAGVPWLGMPVEEAGALDRLLLVGSFLRKDHPLFAARIRQAVKRGAKVSIVHAADDDLLMPLANKAIVAPSQWVRVLAEVLAAALQAQGRPVPAGLAAAVSIDLAAIVPGEPARAIAASLSSGGGGAVRLGNAAVQHPDYARIARLGLAIAAATGARFGQVGDAANSVGGYLARAVPSAGGLDARAMVEQPRGLYLLLNNEPTLDHAMPAAARAALSKAESVIALTAYRSAELLEYADCLLPIAPFTETAGTFVNCEGRVQSFNGVVRPAGESRPAWKVLRVLGNLLGLGGFEHDSPEAVRAEALSPDVAGHLDNALADSAPAAGAPAVPATPGALERLADVPIYSSDPIVRRAESLQKTRDARPARARANGATIARLGLVAGDPVRVRQSAGGVAGEATLELERDDALADGVVRVAAGQPGTAGLVCAFGAISIEKA